MKVDDWGSCYAKFRSYREVPFLLWLPSCYRGRMERKNYVHVTIWRRNEKVKWKTCHISVKRLMSWRIYRWCQSITSIILTAQTDPYRLLSPRHWPLLHMPLASLLSLPIYWFYRIVSTRWDSLAISLHPRLPPQWCDVAYKRKSPWMVRLYECFPWPSMDFLIISW